MPPPTAIRPGLVSITFRKFSPQQVLALAQRAGIDGIEWGGDVHVPHGDLSRAKDVRKMTKEAGLVVSAYGSYYRCGAPPEKTPAWDAVQASAAALGANAIRVWAGAQGSAAASADDRMRVVDDLHRICRAAAKEQMTVDLEYHANMFTDTLASTQTLLDEVNEPNLRTFWQPRHGIATEESIQDIHTLSPRLSNVHVFHWWPTHADKKPLAEGVDRWRPFFSALKEDGRERFASLEFVLNDDPEQFVRDAKTLKELLAYS